MRKTPWHLGVARALAVLVLLAGGFGAPAWAAGNPHGLAIIVGNKTYAGRIPPVKFAHRDAAAMKRFVVDVLGFKPSRVIELPDATQGTLTTWFGSESNHRGKAFQLAKAGQSDIVVFYSGHGMPGLSDKRGYLLPVDADPATAEINGLALDVLYKNLGKMMARSVTVFIDACFSGDSHSGMLITDASPIFIKTDDAAEDKITVISAASGEQVASWDSEARHGLFTHHLVDALYGKGDRNQDGRVSVAEIEDYLADTMTEAAHGTYNRVQKASVRGTQGAVLSAFVPGQPPQRPRLRPRDFKLPKGTPTQGGGAMVKAESVRLPGGITLADWALLAQDRLERGDYADLLIEATRHRDNYGQVDQLEAVFDAAVTGLLGELEIRDAEDARRALPRLQGLRKAAGARPPILAAEARALHKLDEFDAATKAYQGWLATAGGDHPDRKRILVAMMQAQRRESLLASLRDCDFCPRMVVLPPGTLTLGSPASEPAHSPREAPRRQVRLARAFAISKYEITRGEFARFLEDIRFNLQGPCQAFDGTAFINASNRHWQQTGFVQGDNHPVVCVNWHEAKNYAAWLSKRTGQRYRLPSEAEWEYAARGRIDAATYWTQESAAACAFANGADQSFARRFPAKAANAADCSDGFAGTSPVGRYRANRFGLYDMLGNALEWVADCWTDDHANAPADGAVRETADCSRKVVRGGSWYHRAAFLRAAWRYRNAAAARSTFLGFRVVREID